MNSLTDLCSCHRGQGRESATIADRGEELTGRSRIEELGISDNPPTSGGVIFHDSFEVRVRFKHSLDGLAVAHTRAFITCARLPTLNLSMRP